MDNEEHHSKMIKEMLEEKRNFDLYMEQLWKKFLWEYVKQNADISKKDIDKFLESATYEDIYNQMVISSKYDEEMLNASNIMFCKTRKFLGEFLFNVLD